MATIKKIRKQQVLIKLRKIIEPTCTVLRKKLSGHYSLEYTYLPLWQMMPDCCPKRPYQFTVPSVWGLCNHPIGLLSILAPKKKKKKNSILSLNSKSFYPTKQILSPHFCSIVYTLCLSVSICILDSPFTK